MSAVDWTVANQRVLVAEFGRLMARFSGEDASTAESELAAARGLLREPAAIDFLVDALELSGFERDILLLCAGVEMNAGLAAALARALGSTTATSVTFGVAIARLGEPHWSALAPVSPLRAWRLIELRDQSSLTSSRLTLDERVMHYIAGLNYLDPRLHDIVRPHTDETLLSSSQMSLVDSALDALDTHHSSSHCVQFHGDDPVGQLEVARRVAERLGLKLHVLRSQDIPASAQEADALKLLWSRETIMSPVALFLQADDAKSAAASRLAEHTQGLLFIGCRRPMALNRPDIRFAVDRPNADEQKRLWMLALGAHAARLNGSLDSIAGQFRVSTDVMTRAAEVLGAQSRSMDEVESIVRTACSDSIDHRLDELAQRIVPAASWDDLVLPEAELSMLRQIATHVRQRSRVFEDWGFADKCARGIGISVLFSGESGTGKTMAAEVLANELRLELYRIDLASLVSKFIGETEKNLRRVFDAAEDSGAILLFDEADALFGKRSEVTDSHDRYANIEVSYLLQRMEAYRGLAILTSNLKSALDPAFQRRLRFIVQFPFPDQQQREQIWRRIFPSSTPLDQIDHAKLARLNVAGGCIRNIALNAAFLAAESARPVSMAHLLQAVRSEAAKRERPFSDAETREWVRP
jgi:ATP-dependent 26S proteasome regulatory subunit